MTSSDGIVELRLKSAEGRLDDHEARIRRGEDQMGTLASDMRNMDTKMDFQTATLKEIKDQGTETQVAASRVRSQIILSVITIVVTVVITAVIQHFLPKP